MSADDAVRLPEDVVPSHYDLWVKPNLDDFTFEGKVTINYKRNGQAGDNKTSFILHANDIKITQGNLNNNSKLVDTTYNEKTGTAKLTFDSEMALEGQICLHYAGKLNDLMAGFYRTKMQVDGCTVYAATTQLESTDARRLLPCWDEPAFKATFDVTICYKPKMVYEGKTIDYVALSNTPIASQSGDSEITVKFDTTPKMSTYLLAIIVGPFEYIEKTDGKRPVRVYTAIGKKQLGTFALDVACKALNYFEDYFQIDYPLGKLDLIAIPDFACGAMENWGLVTYRETTLLVDPKNSTTARKQVVATVVAHELAHQWFGNLVTMQWWTHLWLNEGFASFMEHLCPDHIFPEYNIWSQFVADSYSSAMHLDSLHNSHPIEVIVNHASEVTEIFDLISYEKGASIIRMLHNYIGDDCFRKGMKQYLTKWSHKNAATQDLWASLEEASNKPVSKVMSDWTSKMGYPCLDVAFQRNSDGSVKLTLTQEKFSNDGKLSEEERKMIWHIPVSYTSSVNPEKESEVALMDSKTYEIIIKEAGEGWVNLNPRAIGFYRVRYPLQELDKLSDGIWDKSLPALDRLKIQDDFFALCGAGKMKTDEYVRFLKCYKNETDYAVWASLDSSVGQMSLVFGNCDFIDKFREYMRDIYSKIFSAVGWSVNSGEGHVGALLRSLILSRMVSLEDSSAVSEGLKKFNEFVTAGQEIEADLRMTVYKVASRFGTDDHFDKLIQMYLSAQLAEEKVRILSALPFTKSPSRLAKVAELAFSDQVRDSDKLFVFSALGRSNAEFAWKLFKDKKDYMSEKFGTSALKPRITTYVIENLMSEEAAQDVEKWFAENGSSGTERSLQQGLETIRHNVEILRRDEAAVRNTIVNNK